MLRDELQFFSYHLFQITGFCIPQNRDSFCSIIRGRTNIYLDTGVTDARDIAYTALEAALSDPKFVVLFEPNVTFSRFLRSVHESILLVAADEPTKGDNEAPSTPATLTVAIAISSVVFVVISIFLYGIVRQQKRLNSRHQDAAAQREASRKSRRERRRYFRTMDSNDDSTSVPIAQLTTDHDGTSFPWSDITSDSASVVSILSRSPSIRLQKIDEEPDHERHAEVEAIWDLQAPLSSHYRVAYMAHKGRLQEIVRQACFDDPVEDNKTSQTTPTTEATFPTSFTDSDNIVVSDSSLQDPPSVECKTPTARLTLSDFDTPPSGIPQENNTKDNDTATNDAPSVTIVTIDQSPAWSDQAFDNNTDNDQGFAPRSDVSLNQSIDTNDSDASLQRWLARLLLELHLSQQTKRIEL